MDVSQGFVDLNNASIKLVQDVVSLEFVDSEQQDDVKIDCKGGDDHGRPSGSNPPKLVDVDFCSQYTKVLDIVISSFAMKDINATHELRALNGRLMEVVLTFLDLSSSLPRLTLRIGSSKAQTPSFVEKNGWRPCMAT